MTYTYTVHNMDTGGGVWVARKVMCVFPRFHRVCVYLIEYVCIKYVCMASRCAAVNKGAKGGGAWVARADGCGGLHASEKLGDAMAGRKRERGGGNHVIGKGNRAPAAPGTWALSGKDCAHLSHQLQHKAEAGAESDTGWN